MNKHKRIFVVGHSGAGKGILAQAVAKQLGWKFINAGVLDCIASIGRSVTYIFGQESENRFNQILTEILQHLVTQENIVVNTDENVICNKTAREILKSEFTINVEVSTSIQVDRMGNDRPLLPVDDYAALLNELHKERDALYAEVASFTLNSDDGDIDSHVKSIIQELIV